MDHRIEFLWFLDPTGTRYTVRGTFRGTAATTSAEVAAAAVRDQRQRQAIEEELALGLEAQVAGLDRPHTAA